ncbi:MAG: type VI secretion system contractile sheath small subunit [Saprospiraceae bacterium]
MAKEKKNVGANSLDGIQGKVGITYLPPNRTLLMMPLQGDDCPTDPEEMVIQGDPTYSLEAMFKLVKPKVDVSLKTGDEKTPLKDETIPFNTVSDFDPEKIVDNVPMLRNLKDQQLLIQKLETLMQEGAFKRMLQNKSQKAALVAFLQSVIADIEAHEGNE